MLGKHQQETLFYFFDTLTAILAESHVCDSLNKLRRDLNTVLALLERDFPLIILCSTKLSQTENNGY